MQDLYCITIFVNKILQIFLVMIGYIPCKQSLSNLWSIKISINLNKILSVKMIVSKLQRGKRRGKMYNRVTIFPDKQSEITENSSQIVAMYVKIIR